MVALAKPTTKPAQQTRRDYIASAQILIEGNRASITGSTGDRYTVLIEDGKAAGCDCGDREYRKAYCKHMAATDSRIAPSLPLMGTPEMDELIGDAEEIFKSSLPEGFKMRKVRGKKALVRVALPKESKEEVKEIKGKIKGEAHPAPVEDAAPAAQPKAPAPTTWRRTARLTQPTPHVITIIERNENEDGVVLRVADSATPGREFTVTLRRDKRHECTCADARIDDVRCGHIEHCVGAENARWRAEQEAKKAEQEAAEKATAAKQDAPRAVRSTEERREYADLNGRSRGFSLLRQSL